MLLKTHDDYTHEHQTIAAFDNHDLTRFRHIQSNDKPYHAAIAALMTTRGTPKIYYGTEQYVVPDSDGPNAGRVFVQTDSSFDTTSTAYLSISDLAQLRKETPGITYGQTRILHSTDDVIVFERQFYDHVAVNRQPDSSESGPSLGTNLHDGSYGEYLGGDLFGQGIGVSGGSLGSFSLGGGEVSVWASTPDLGTPTPRIDTTVSTMGRAGNSVPVFGTGLGGSPTVEFDGVTATVVANSDTELTATVPTVTPGLADITVEKNGQMSNPTTYEVLSDGPVQVAFHVDASTVLGETIHVVGDIPELGNWDTAESSESFVNPNYPEWFPVSAPKNASFEFKFIKRDENGNVTWESGSTGLSPRRRTRQKSPTRRCTVGVTKLADFVHSRSLVLVGSLAR